MKGRAQGCPSGEDNNRSARLNKKAISEDTLPPVPELLRSQARIRVSDGQGVPATERKAQGGGPHSSANKIAQRSQECAGRAAWNPGPEVGQGQVPEGAQQSGGAAPVRLRFFSCRSSCTPAVCV